MPLFNKFIPLGEEHAELAERLLQLAKRSGTFVKGVFTFDMSKRTKQANAGLTGLGNTRRIILGDTLLSEFSVDEIETVISFGYDRIWFADDCFTLNRGRLIEVCDGIIDRKLRIGWECLSRVDTFDSEIADKMKKAGCLRIFFGIESGNDFVLRIMKKQITTRQASIAIQICKKKGIKAGAFFILGYPGENYQTILDTVKFASSLPLDYLSFTLPYPIPGTALFERIKKELALDEWQEPKNLRLIKHTLLFDSKITESRLKLIILKGMIQFYIRKYLGQKGYSLLGEPFEKTTDLIFTKDY